MTKIEITRDLADTCGLMVPHAKQVTDRFFELMRDTITNGERIEIRNFGSWEISWSKPKLGRNPKNPTVTFPVPARPRVKFKPSNEWQNELWKNQGKKTP